VCPSSNESSLATCKLCGASPTDSASGPFCCEGCSRVFEVIESLDEEAQATYFEAAQRAGIIPVRDEGGPQNSRKPFAESIAIKTQRLEIRGLVCPSCAWVAERIMESTQGITKATVDFFTGFTSLSYDMRRISLVEVRKALLPFGYELSESTQKPTGRLARRPTVEFLICAILTVNIMSLASVRYFGLEDLPWFLVWLELGLVTPILWMGHIPMMKRAWVGLLDGHLNMDFLIALAVAAAFLLSVFSLLAGREDIYFETCAGLVTINLLSRMIEAKLRDRALGELRTLMRLPATRVRIPDGTGIRYLEVEKVERGQVAVFEPDEIVVLDGEVVSKELLVSEAVLTGEPKPIHKSTGDRIVAGTRVVEGALHILVTKKYEETMLHRISQTVTESIQKLESRLRSADRISNRLAPVVLLIALGAWLFRANLFGWDVALASEGWMPSVAVLVVACPCAFSLAGISAVTAATGLLLRRGVLVTQTAQLDRLSDTSRVIFDKTGTLTAGLMEVESISWKEREDESLLDFVLAAEQDSMHPVAQSIRHHLADRGNQASRKGEVSDVVGKGRILSTGNQHFAVGSGLLFEDSFVPDHIEERHTLAYFGYDGRAVGCFLLSDPAKPNSRKILEELIGQGLSPQIVSGDREEAVHHLVERLGLEPDENRYRGNVTIQNKVDLVRELEQQGVSTAFVGDGTNDALAMKAASVSIAVRKSTDEALSASGFILLRDDISLLPFLFGTGMKLRRVIRSNYVWAFAFNGFFVPIAAMGNFIPLIAMLLMLVSSTAVLINSLRLRR